MKLVLLNGQLRCAVTPAAADHAENTHIQDEAIVMP